MSFQHVDMGAVMRRLADKRIEEAMEEGKFDNLPGAGKPLDLEPMPADENARLMWWAMRIFRQNDVVPEEIQWRKAIDHLKLAIARLTEESPLEGLVIRVNELVHKLNTLGTNAINLAVTPLNLEDERRRLRERMILVPLPCKQGRG